MATPYKARLDQIGCDVEFSTDLLFNNIEIKINGVAWDDLPHAEEPVPERDLAIRETYQEVTKGLPQWYAYWILQHGDEGVGVDLNVDHRTNWWHIQVSTNDMFVLNTNNRLLTQMDKPFSDSMEGEIGAEGQPPLTMSAQT